MLSCKITNIHQKPASNTAPMVRVLEAHGQHSLKELNVVNEVVDLLLNGMPSLPATDNET